MVDDVTQQVFYKTGRGTHEHCGVVKRVNIITSTLINIWAEQWEDLPQVKKEIIDILRQKSRPYLFSNSLAPSIVGASIEVLNIIEETTSYRDKLELTQIILELR